MSEKAKSEVSKLRVLFVCNQNRMRSPTAERVFADHPSWEVKSAGIAKDAAVPLNRELLEWADLVFVMEKRQRNVIHKKFKDLYRKKRIICLYIPDEYGYMDPELVPIVRARIGMYLR